ncbi:hypothetical protein E2C01_059607 [Portunus trituberculatus]|uniref:Uncharacterized protein n=1 Tax=Portunus trituberculatus TaxID=210409 RepID=A0A5B7H9I7_PORTR|nr:hypothetical protein [Portunus trituberculatus]
MNSLRHHKTPPPPPQPTHHSFHHASPPHAVRQPITSRLRGPRYHHHYHHHNLHTTLLPSHANPATLPSSSEVPQEGRGRRARANAPCGDRRQPRQQLLPGWRGLETVSGFLDSVGQRSTPVHQRTSMGGGLFVNSQLSPPTREGRQGVREGRCRGSDYQTPAPVTAGLAGRGEGGREAGTTVSGCGTWRRMSLITLINCSDGEGGREGGRKGGRRSSRRKRAEGELE